MRWNLALAGLSASWGLVAVLAGAVSVDAAPLALLRLGLAALTLAVVALVGGRLPLLAPGRHLGTLVALGVVQAVHWWLFFETVKRGSVALAVLTFYAAPLFLALLAPRRT
jgi:drug/metabolite transporter (DMT)-like permease